MTETRSVGRRIDRTDGLSKALGAAEYVEDIHVPGMLHAALARSFSSHARVTVDEQPARSTAGVAAVLSTATISEAVPENRSFDPACHDFERGTPPSIPIPVTSGCSIERIRYVGEPVAAVAARTRKEAQAARGPGGCQLPTARIGGDDRGRHGGGCGGDS